MAVDVETSRQRILARGRQVGFGQPHGNIVPIYGPHWNPGPHRDLELVNVETGQITKSALTADAVCSNYKEWITREFKAPVSIYIPILSPDLTRVFFKMATPLGGDFRSNKASKREGLLVYDLKASRFLTMQERWGHPAWHSNSRQILNVGGTITNVEDGKILRIANYPKLPGSHPSFSPDGDVFTSDLVVEKSWAVGVGSVRNGEFLRLNTFDNSKGARSWRVSHPHPVFSSDGRRLYFNVSADDWTRLFVAEVSQ
jgi:hypothetical protein